MPPAISSRSFKKSFLPMMNMFFNSSALRAGDAQGTDLAFPAHAPCDPLQPGTDGSLQPPASFSPSNARPISVIERSSSNRRSWPHRDHPHLRRQGLQPAGMLRVGQHDIRSQGDQGFHADIQETADLVYLLGRLRIIAELRHPDQGAAAVDGENDLGQPRSQGNDTLGKKAG